jgi:hypothetical protein
MSTNQSEDELSKLANSFIARWGLSSSNAFNEAKKEMESRRRVREYEELKSKLEYEFKIREMEHIEKMKGCCNN